MHGRSANRCPTVISNKLCDPSYKSRLPLPNSEHQDHQLKGGIKKRKRVIKAGKVVFEEVESLSVHISVLLQPHFSLLPPEAFVRDVYCCCPATCYPSKTAALAVFTVRQTLSSSASVYCKLPVSADYRSQHPQGCESHTRARFAKLLLFSDLSKAAKNNSRNYTSCKHNTAAHECPLSFSLSAKHMFSI